MSFEEKLVNLVKDQDYLYNTKSRSYKNSTKRAVAWDNIARSLNRSVPECKQRWRSLRDRFTREHRSMTSLPSGSAAIFDADDKWEYYDCLDFLIPSLITRKQIGNTEIDNEDGDVHISPPQKNANRDNDIATKRTGATKRKNVEKTFEKFMQGLNTTVSAHLNETTVDVDEEFMLNMAKKNEAAARIHQDPSTCTNFKFDK